MTQTTYSTNHEAAYAGQIFGEIRDVRSYAATTAIPFGRAMLRSAVGAERSVKLADGAGEFMGVSARVLHLQADAANSIQYEIGDEVSALDRGEIWVVCTDNFGAGTAVYYADADGTFQAAATAAQLIVGATWETTGSAGDLAKLRLAAPFQDVTV